MRAGIKKNNFNFSDYCRNKQNIAIQRPRNRFLLGQLVCIIMKNLGGGIAAPLFSVVGPLAEIKEQPA